MEDSVVKMHEILHKVGHKIGVDQELLEEHKPAEIKSSDSHLTHVVGGL